MRVTRNLNPPPLRPECERAEGISRAEGTREARTALEGHTAAAFVALQPVVHVIVLEEGPALRGEMEAGHTEVRIYGLTPELRRST